MISLKPVLAQISAICLAAAIGLPAQAADWALGGFDPVSLRVDGQAEAGAVEIYTHWHGKVWHFTSEENRAAFEENPRAYVPGFDGLCPVTLDQGRPSPGNPLYFVMIGERVYLTRSEAARQKLMQNPREVLMGAKASWLRIGPASR